MNSIEVVSNPERKKADPSQYQPDGPTLRVFVKEGDGYALLAETDSYRRAMEIAEKSYMKGKDILVNEKDNPQIVHAKSNRNKEVAIGREIHPNEPGGVLKRGAGEVLLAAFYEKLPMDTKAFDERQRAGKEADKTAQELAKAVGGPTKDQSPKAPASLVGEQSKEQQRILGEQQRADVKAPPKDKDSDGPVEVGAKVVLSKTGYALPETVIGAYLVKDGKFHDRDSNALRFEDHGKKLSTPVEDRKVVADMVHVAAAKNWGALELKGTDTFKQLAWLEAESRGIQTKGYKPNERDLEQLEKLREERSTQPLIREANEIRHTAVPTRQQDEPKRGSKQAEDSGKSDKAAPEATALGKEVAREPGRTEAISGKLIDHGKAKYQHAPEEKDSYYVKLQTAKGEKLIWGKDLERAMAESKVKLGDQVLLELKGSKPVTVEANKRDEQGRVVGTEEIGSHLNKWEVRPIELKPSREVSADERTKLAAAEKVMGKALDRVPPHMRGELMERIQSAVERGNLKLPDPKVIERSADKARPAPAPSMDRSR